MTTPAALLILLSGGFVAATIASVTGFGGAAILLPIAVAVFGFEDAVPILTIAQLIGNGSRVWLNRHEISLPVVKWFAFGSVPAAIFGSLLFKSAPVPILVRLLGCLLIAMVVWRHIPQRRTWRMPLRGFVPVGVVSGVLSALTGSVGPLVAPFFLAFGLVKGAYIGTEALAAVIVHTTKTASYGGLSLLSRHNIAVGLLLGPAMILGSVVGKKVVDWLPERIFLLLVESSLVIAGFRFLRTQKGDRYIFPEPREIPTGVWVLCAEEGDANSTHTAQRGDARHAKFDRRTRRIGIVSPLGR